MHIGIIIGRIGGVDGVALETEKWISVLEKMGHTIFILSGSLTGSFKEATNCDLLPELDFFHPQNVAAQKDSFFEQTINEGVLKERLEKESLFIKENILKWTKKRAIEIIISENANALPYHLTMGIGIQKALAESSLPAITHDHDFAWERGDRYKTKYAFLQELLLYTFPVTLPRIIHCVINTPAKVTLKTRFNLDSIVVPNVMDFSEEYGKKENYNSDLPDKIGLKKGDLPLFQVTRIIDRKGIETAIHLVKKINDKRVKLVIAGSAEDDPNQTYVKTLFSLVERLDLKEKVFFESTRIQRFRVVDNNQKIFSLSDAYAHATACTYFSTYEGFGNAFVEAVLAKKPIFVNNYKPVYWPDIGSKGFKTVMLEDNVLTADRIEEIKKIIYNPQLAEEIGDFNFQLGKKYFSYVVLEKLLREALTLANK